MVDNPTRLGDSKSAVSDSKLPELDTALVQISTAGAVAIITINRPEKLNAVTAQMSAALVQAVQWANDSELIRVVVLTGAGERAFSAGSDIRQLDEYATAWDFRNRTDYCDALRQLRKPVIAAINGYAFGGGLEAALNCDIRLAAESASFAAPEIKLGWIGGGGVTALLTASIGASNTALMLYTGDPISAQQALQWGLVSEVLPLPDLVPRAVELAQVIAKRPPIAAETVKQNLRAAYNMPQAEAMQYERDLQTICFATEDAAEGRAAFSEKRPGVFRRK